MARDLPPLNALRAFEAGIRSAPYGAMMLAAWRGEARTARELIDTSIRDAGARGEGMGLAVAEYARAVLANGLGEYEEALSSARSASEYREVVVENWGLSELIEPAARTGRTDLATDALDRIAAKAAATAPSERTYWAHSGHSLIERGIRSLPSNIDSFHRGPSRGCEENCRRPSWHAALGCSRGIILAPRGGSNDNR